MFNQNLKAIRKEKGFSQETLAERLNVVRQTVSKWEKGLSVPDAEMLIRIAEVLETSVAVLLGDTVEENTTDKNVISQQLEQLNAMLAERNKRSRRIWKIIAIILISSFILTALLILFSIVSYNGITTGPAINTENAIITNP